MKIRLETLEKTDLKRIKDWIDPSLFRVYSYPVDEKQLEKLLTKYDGELPVELGYKAVDFEESKIVGVTHLKLRD